jgi:hypothetical protein
MSRRGDRSVEWRSRVGFHAALLKLFDPEDAAALQRTGQVLYDLAYGVTRPYDPAAESLTAQHLRAVLVDLELLRDCLLDASLRVEQTNLELPEARLCVLAADCGEGVGRVVDAIKAGLQ